MQLFNGVSRRLHRIVDYERLTFSFQVLLCDDVDNSAKFLEDFSQSFDERRDLGLLGKVLDLS